MQQEIEKLTFVKVISMIDPVLKTLIAILLVELIIGIIVYINL